MNENKTALLVAFVIVIVLLVFMGIGIMSGGMLDGMGTGRLVGINWMWLPLLLLIILSGILLWIMFGKKK